MRLPPWLLLLAAAACGGSPDPAPADAFPLTVHSASGALTLVLRPTPDPPTVGTDAMELTVSMADGGVPSTDLDVSVVPWMVAMDHGTSAPTVTPEGGGRYLVTNLYFYMQGVWELRLGFTGPVTDHAEPQFQVQ